MSLPFFVVEVDSFVVLCCNIQVFQGDMSDVTVCYDDGPIHECYG
jgi:hypothetical protein